MLHSKNMDPTGALKFDKRSTFPSQVHFYWTIDVFRYLQPLLGTGRDTFDFLIFVFYQTQLDLTNTSIIF